LFYFFITPPQKIERAKPRVNIGTIGRGTHCNKSLAAAIAKVMAETGAPELKNHGGNDDAPKERD